MNWEAVTAISTAFTAVVILVSALAALRQLNEAQCQQAFQGSEALLERWESKEMRAARRYVLDELPLRIDDPIFREAILRAGSGAELGEHPELVVLRFLERVGVYIHYGLLPGDAIYEQLFLYLIRAWPQLYNVALLVRESEDNPYVFDKTELLYENMLRVAEKQARKIRRVLPSSGEVATVEAVVRRSTTSVTPRSEENRTQ